MEIELHLLSPLALAAAQPAGTGLWAGLVTVEPADTEPLAGSLAVLVVDTEPQAGSLVVLVIDMEQLVSAAFAGRPGAFPEECLASGFVVLGPMGLWLVYQYLCQRVRVIPQCVEPLGEVGSN